MKLFNPSVYAQRRAQLMKNMGSGLILLPGAVEQAFNYKANTYLFRQDSTFLYYFGIQQSGMAGVIDADNGTSTLYGHDADIEEVVWMGPQPTLAELASLVGAEKHESIDKLANALKGKEVHFLKPYHADRILYLADLLGKSVQEIQEGQSLPLVHAIINQRSYKSSEEIAEMEDAMKISAAIHAQLRKSVAPPESLKRISAVYRKGLHLLSRDV